MRTRTHSPFFLSLVVAALTLAAPASADIVLQVVGAIQGSIPGNSSLSGHINWIDLSSFQHGVGVGIGPDGLPTGPPTLTDVVVTKIFDRSSIKLLAAISNNEVFSTFTLEFLDQATSAVYYRVVLEGARISGFSQSSGGERPSESVSFSYSKIILTDVSQGTSVTYTRYPDGATATAPPAQLEMAVFLPVSPNPMRGGTAFQFMLPGASDAELTLFDVQGRRVRELHRGWTSAQPVVARWDGTDDRGARVAPGIYMARLSYPGRVVTQRFAVVR
jgi:type VI secretion system secreted protein Hcp